MPFFEGEKKFYIEPFTAWRGWKANPQGHLFAVSHQVEWRPREDMHAVCNGGAMHDAPDADCSCGIYCLKSAEHVTRHVTPRIGGREVIGQVSIWGRIIVATEGYRAEYARIERLFVPGYEEYDWNVAKWMYDIYDPPHNDYRRAQISQMCNRLKELYEVPVHTYGRIADLANIASLGDNAS